MKLDRRILTQARLALRQAVRDWIHDPNVMLIDFGWPEHGGKIVRDELAIRVHVVEKFTSRPALETAIDEGVTRAKIPSVIGVFPVDVPQGTYKLHQWLGSWWRRRPNPRADRANPLQGGISISNARHRGYGTLGGLVYDRDTDEQMLLSNWHVLAGDWGARPGWPIYQPGRGDGGRRSDTVATLVRDAMTTNLDAAIAKLTGSRELVNDQLDLGVVRGVDWAHLGMKVVKSGRRTGVTRGLVTAVEGTILLNYQGRDHLIGNVVTIEPRQPLAQLSAGGDSGSFWLHEDTLHVVGLHFAGSDQPERALAMDMHPVLDTLNVRVVP